jgi:hypothetical protein
MKTKIISLSIFVLLGIKAFSKDLVIKVDSTNTMSTTTYNGDTTSVHKVINVGDHLVIIDTIKIEKVKPVVKEVVKTAPDPLKKYVGFMALLFAVLAILNAKRSKNKDNGTKD